MQRRARAFFCIPSVSCFAVLRSCSKCPCSMNLTCTISLRGVHSENTQIPKRQLTTGSGLPKICPAVQLPGWAGSTARSELDKPVVYCLPFGDVAVAQTNRASMNAARRLSFTRFDHPLVPNFCPAVALHAGRLLGSDRRLGAVYLFPLSSGTCADEVHRHRP